jgi:HAD superfamily phosphatase (TIGR01668 family)
MSWFNHLQPDLVLGSPITSLTPNILVRHQLKGLILDVDETLVPRDIPEASAELIRWIREIQQVARLSLVSNNNNAQRIATIAQSLDLPYFVSAQKPSRRKLRQAWSQMNLPLHHMAMVGDRLLTDVLAGNRLGMFTILVEPMITTEAVIRFSPFYALEVAFSQALGISLASNLHKFTENDKSSNK